MPIAEAALHHSLLARLTEARRRSDEVFGIACGDSLYDRPIPERHRIVFYIGHLEAFDWNLMGERLFDQKSIHESFDRLFAFGIDPVGGGLPTDQPTDWPSLKEVRHYTDRIRERIDAGIAPLLREATAGMEFSPETLLHVAVEHRLMHAETLAYMLHRLPLDRKVGRAEEVAPAAPVLAAEVKVPSGTATLGLSRHEPEFGWCNEYEAHRVEVPAFLMDQYKVSNGEYLQFLAAGGYQNRDWWTEADWEWKTEKGIEHPVFWNRVDDGWLYRTMFNEVRLPNEWPVYVSQAEASAYARWAGKTLPTEAQWHRGAYGTQQGTENPYPWGAELPSPGRGNFDFQSWNPQAVNAHLMGRSAFGIDDMLGNGWEWTSTQFGPFPGFERFSFYPGYSADFFDGKHYVMKGGSARTAACMLRRTFRNWFQGHYQYVYAGFRCVRNL
jgi:ergothioneine biosynthesis protein EgtB